MRLLGGKYAVAFFIVSNRSRLEGRLLRWSKGSLFRSIYSINNKLTFQYLQKNSNEELSPCSVSLPLPLYSPIGPLLISFPRCLACLRSYPFSSFLFSRFSSVKEPNYSIFSFSISNNVTKLQSTVTLRKGEIYFQLSWISFDSSSSRRRSAQFQ